MNWGWGIVVGLGAFMLFIVGSVIYMTSQDQDSLEESDYYERGLHYDEVYTLRENLNKHDAKPTVSIEQDTLRIYFTRGDNNGKMTWKRPSDGSLDRTVPFVTSTGVFKLPMVSFERGNWQLELRWESNAVPFLSEHVVHLQ